MVWFSDSIEGLSLQLIHPLLNSEKGFHNTFLVLHRDGLLFGKSPTHQQLAVTEVQCPTHEEIMARMAAMGVDIVRLKMC